MASWCWKRVRNLLAAEGHQVFTPTLTGLAERVHLLSRDVTLETHIADVTNLIIYEDIRDIELVGHSYGGIVVRHLADRMPGRIRSLVYLDAFVPDDGKALTDYLPDAGKMLRELTASQGDGWKVPRSPRRFSRLMRPMLRGLIVNAPRSRCPPSKLLPKSVEPAIA
jgi:pimeloyl-ACP methyl ester carboxylesterase